MIKIRNGKDGKGECIYSGKVHLCANQLLGRWEIMTHDNIVLDYGTLEQCNVALKG